MVNPANKQTGKELTSRRAVYLHTVTHKPEGQKLKGSCHVTSKFKINCICSCATLRRFYDKNTVQWKKGVQIYYSAF